MELEYKNRLSDADDVFKNFEKDVANENVKLHIAYSKEPVSIYVEIRQPPIYSPRNEKFPYQVLLALSKN
jgi:hypothetical protein